MHLNPSAASISADRRARPLPLQAPRRLAAPARTIIAALLLALPGTGMAPAVQAADAVTVGVDMKTTFAADVTVQGSLAALNVLAAGVPVSVSAATSLAASACGKWHFLSSSAGNYRVTLPSAVGLTGQLIGFRTVTGGVGVPTVAAATATPIQTIDNLAEVAVAGGSALILMSDGSGWARVGGSPAANPPSGGGAALNTPNKWALFTTPGQFTWTAPAALKDGVVYAYVVGGGGGGGGAGTQYESITTTAPNAVVGKRFAKASGAPGGNGGRASGALSVTAGATRFGYVGGFGGGGGAGQYIGDGNDTVNGASGNLINSAGLRSGGGSGGAGGGGGGTSSFGATTATASDDPLWVGGGGGGGGGIGVRAIEITNMGWIGSAVDGGAGGGSAAKIGQPGGWPTELLNGLKSWALAYGGIPAVYSRGDSLNGAGGAGATASAAATRGAPGVVWRQLANLPLAFVIPPVDLNLTTYGTGGFGGGVTWVCDPILWVNEGLSWTTSKLDYPCSGNPGQDGTPGCVLLMWRE